MFEILFRYSSNIEGRSFILPIVGKPYRGEFEADVRVEVEIVPDLQKETSSKSSIVLSQNGEYNHLKDSINKNMQTWVKSIILADDMLKIKMAYFGEYQQNLQRIIASTTCEEEEICENFPKITCSRYSLQAVCIKTKNVCSIMTQQCAEEEKLCSRSDDEGNCFEYVSVCRQWENTCVDSTDVCIDFEEREIPDQCIKVELKCTKILKQSEHCLRSLEHFNKKLNEVNHDMELINEWIDLTHELVDSSVCSIKVTDPNERAKYTSCTNKQIATDPYDENVDILDLVRLKNTTSFMALREIISSDSIIFETDVQLYGDWVSKKSSDHLIGSSPAPRDEYPGDEYDVGRKSRVDIKHIIDFKNIDGTGSEISNRLEQTICKEFGITEEKSQRMQIILREFSDLNAYPQICKPYTEVKSPYIKSQDTEGKDQVSIYGTINDEGTGLEKAETKMYTSKTKTGIEEITYVYNSDPKIVDETQIKHSYVNEIEGDDEELLGLDQRLISSVEEQKELSSLTNNELEEKEKKERKEAENQRNKEYDEAKDIQKQQEEQDKRNKDQADKETEKVNNENDARIDSIQQDKTNPQAASFQENNEVELDNQVQQNSEQEATFTEPTTVQASDSDVDESLPEISSSEELNEVENKDSASVSESSTDSEETPVSEEIESEPEQELSSNTFEATTDSNAYTVDSIDSESTTEANNEYSEQQIDEQMNSVVS